MSIDSLSDYFVQVQRLIDGEDVSIANVNVATLQQIIVLAQRRIYREVRSRYNEKPFTTRVTGNLAALPTDYEECSVVHFGASPLDPVSEEWLLDYLSANPSGGPRYFADAGRGLMFGPAAPDGAICGGRYFHRFPDLNAGNLLSNALLAREPDLFVYAAVAEAIPFFPVSAKDAVLFRATYGAIRDRINEDRSNSIGRAGRMKRRTSATMIDGGGLHRGNFRIGSIMEVPVANTAPRFGVGSATAGVDNPAALLASMTLMEGGLDGGIAGTFTVDPGAGLYGWAAFAESASSAGVTFADWLGTGGWQGAGSPGNNPADDGSSPNTSTVTYSDGFTSWRLFRQSYAAAGGSFTTS